MARAASTHDEGSDEGPEREPAAEPIVVRPKWLWRWGFPTATVVAAVLSAVSGEPRGLLYVAPGAMATWMAWGRRLEVDEVGLTVRHVRPPFRPRPALELDRQTLRLLRMLRPDDEG